MSYDPTNSGPWDPTPWKPTPPEPGMGQNDTPRAINSPWNPPSYNSPAPSQPASPPTLHFPSFPPPAEAPGRKAASSGSSGTPYRHAYGADVARTVALPAVLGPSQTRYNGNYKTNGFWRVSDWVTRVLFPLAWLRSFGRLLDDSGKFLKFAVACVGAIVAWQWPAITSHNANGDPNWIIIGVAAVGGWIAPQLLGKIILFAVHLLVFALLIASLGAISYGAWLGFAHFASQ